ncbi:MAG: nucleotidyltransferase domain-containing protein [Nitrospinota bacterium]|nr:MAG: nucleotidyltransferase domain-containing protein [Nitrospinota bacterium]
MGVVMSNFPEKRLLPLSSLPQTVRDQIRQRFKEVLESCNDIVFAYLYGSFARGEPFRDVDVALYTSGEKDFHYEARLSYRLKQLTGLEVDVRVINHAPVPFLYEIFREGKLLFSCNESLRTNLIDKVSRQYREYAHFRNLFLGVAGVRS